MYFYTNFVILTVIIPFNFGYDNYKKMIIAMEDWGKKSYLPATPIKIKQAKIQNLNNTGDESIANKRSKINTGSSDAKVQVDDKSQRSQEKIILEDKGLYNNHKKIMSNKEEVEQKVISRYTLEPGYTGMLYGNNEKSTSIKTTTRNTFDIHVTEYTEILHDRRIREVKNVDRTVAPLEERSNKEDFVVSVIPLLTKFDRTDLILPVIPLNKTEEELLFVTDASLSKTDEKIPQVISLNKTDKEDLHVSDAPLNKTIAKDLILPVIPLHRTDEEFLFVTNISLNKTDEKFLQVIPLNETDVSLNKTNAKYLIFPVVPLNETDEKILQVIPLNETDAYLNKTNAKDFILPVVPLNETDEKNLQVIPLNETDREDLLYSGASVNKTDQKDLILPVIPLTKADEESNNAPKVIFFKLSKKPRHKDIWKLSKPLYLGKPQKNNLYLLIITLPILAVVALIMALICYLSKTEGKCCGMLLLCKKK